MCSDPSKAPQPSIEAIKADLESKKLSAEVQRLHAWWWVLPAWFASLTPIMAAIAAIVIPWSLGVFDTKRAQLNLERDKLSLEIARLEERRMPLFADLHRLSNSVATLTAERHTLITETNRLAEQRDHLTASVNGLSQENSSLIVSNRFLSQKREESMALVAALASANTNFQSQAAALTNLLIETTHKHAALQEVLRTSHEAASFITHRIQSVLRRLKLVPLDLQNASKTAQQRNDEKVAEFVAIAGGDLSPTLLNSTDDVFETNVPPFSRELSRELVLTDDRLYAARIRILWAGQELLSVRKASSNLLSVIAGVTPRSP